MQMNEQQSLEQADSQQKTVEQRPNRRVFVPVTRSVEREDAIELTLQLPGVRRDGLELTQEGRRLTVRARVSERTAPEGMRPLVDELRDGDFEARFELPRGIAADRVEAELRAGLLTLSLPRALPERRTIPVRGS